MRVREVMSTNLKTVPPGTAADAAWRRMRQDGLHHLVVQDGGGIAGIFSDRDAGRARGAALRAGHTVGDLMTESVVTVPADTPVKKAANLMRGRSIGCVVVTDDRRPVGIVTTSDLLELLGRGALRPSPVGTRPTLHHRAPHRKRTRAYGAW